MIVLEVILLYLLSLCVISIIWNLLVSHEVTERPVDIYMAVKEKVNEEKEMEKKKKDMELNKNGLKTKELLINTLTEMGCQCEVEQDDDGERIFFMWQGGYFAAYTEDTDPFVHIWYYRWIEYELYDIDKFALVKQIINEANSRLESTTVYTVDEAANLFYIHTKVCFLFIPQIPQITDYLKMHMSLFFRTRYFVEMQLAKHGGSAE